MRIWIVETRFSSPGGHEIEFDRLLIEELQNLNHEVTLALPSDLVPKFDYNVRIYHLKTKAAPLPEKGTLPLKFARSIKSEYRRRNIYLELLNLADSYDGLVFPTATFRFLRTLRFNRLKNSVKPVIFILLGATPKEARKLKEQALDLAVNDRIKVIINTINSSQEPQGLKNVLLGPPPALIPRGVPWRPAPGHDELVLGFFGQYRREKNLPGLLDGILAAHLNRPVKFLIQALAGTPGEQQEVDELAKIYAAKDSRLFFLSRAFFGREWQEAILSLDGLLLPYDAERFKWHWAGMLFNAIGFKRPVLAVKTLNSEVLSRFQIGRTYIQGDIKDLTKVLEEFVNDFDKTFAVYQKGLSEALDFYHPRHLAESIVSLVEKPQS